LSDTRPPVFFPAVIRDRLSQGVYAGIVAAAATAGMLIGFGRARGEAWRPLNAVGHLLLGYRARLMDRFDVFVTPVGVALHLTFVVLWGVLFALVAARLRGWRLAAAAAALGAAALVIDARLLPDGLDLGFPALLSRPELIALYAVLAAALALGIRLARRSEHAAYRE
jgi:hypothetical protein